MYVKYNAIQHYAILTALLEKTPSLFSISTTPGEFIKVKILFKTALNVYTLSTFQFSILQLLLKLKVLEEVSITSHSFLIQNLSYLKTDCQIVINHSYFSPTQRKFFSHAAGNHRWRDYINRTHGSLSVLLQEYQKQTK